MTISGNRLSASGPWAGLANMLSHQFIVYALVAGTAVAALCGLVGYFLILRGQVFAGDALGHVAYTGAMAALVVGVDPRLGLFAATIAGGFALGAASRRGADDVAIGSFFSWVLGLGVLFLTYYPTHGSGRNGTANVNVLFGSIFGLNHASTRAAVVVAVVVSAVLLVMARPLLFATVDPEVAAARGVPVRALGIVFAALVGVVAAQAVQIVGALLVMSLLITPAAAAARVVASPVAAIVASVIFAEVSAVGGIVMSLAPGVPVSVFVATISFLIYLLCWLLGRRREVGA